jgi:hypothetical protein
MPAHKRGSTSLPAGINEVFADGSSAWAKSGTVLNLYTGGGRMIYWYQSDLGTLATASIDKGPE